MNMGSEWDIMIQNKKITICERLVVEYELSYAYE